MFKEVGTSFYSEPVIFPENDEGVYGEETEVESIFTHGQDPYDAGESEDL